MIVSIILTAVLVVAFFLNRWLISSYKTKPNRRFLNAALAMNLFLVSVFYFLIGHRVIERDLYRVALLYMAVFYFGFIMCYRIFRTGNTQA